MSPNGAQAARTDPPTEVAQILDRLARRRSCRDFDGSPVPRGTLEAILADGVEAPSSCNHQNWHFIVVDSPEDRAQARDIAGGNPHFADCGALVYLCFQKGWTHGNFSIVQSVAGACYHMMLSAHLRGLDAIWNAGIGDQMRLRAMLALPATFEVIGALAIGRARPTAPAMKAPRRPLGEVTSWGSFRRPAHAVYPARPAESYPFWRIRNDANPFAEWSPRRWSWPQLADFRGYAVWAKSPLAGVYVSRRQGEATARELALLPDLPADAHMAEIMPWGGTYTAALRRHLDPGVWLHAVDLSPHNLSFVEERMRQEGLAGERFRSGLMDGPRLPFDDASLDAVIAPQIPEQVPEPGALLDEIARVLRPGGAVVVTARNLWSAYGWHWARRERRAQVPNQGPFTPIPAPRLRAMLAARFSIEEETGIGRRATGDAVPLSGPMRFLGRLYGVRARRR